MKKLFIILGVYFLFATSLLAQSQKLSFAWLTGTWKYNIRSGFIVENWQQINDTVYKGKSMLVKGVDSILQESLEIIKKDTNWYYISTVNGQNDNKPISFKIIFSRMGEFICENPTHDFPQRISYLRNLPMFILASIEGYRNGKYAKQNFNFYKDDKNDLFYYTLKPTATFINASASDTTLTNVYKKHLKFIDSLGNKNMVILGGLSSNTPATNVGDRVMIIKAADLEQAKKIIAKDPAIVFGTHVSNLFPFKLSNWFPGNHGQ